MRIEETLYVEDAMFYENIMESGSISRIRDIASNYKGNNSEIIAYQNPNDTKHYKVFVSGDSEQFWFELNNGEESKIYKTSAREMSKSMLELRSSGWKEVSTKNFIGRNWQKIVSMLLIGGVSAGVAGVAAAAFPIIANSILITLSEIKNISSL